MELFLGFIILFLVLYLISKNEKGYRHQVVVEFARLKESFKNVEKCFTDFEKHNLRMIKAVKDVEKRSAELSNDLDNLADVIGNIYIPFTDKPKQTKKAKPKLRIIAKTEKEKKNDDDQGSTVQ